MIVIRSIELESGFGNKFTLKANDPHFTFVVLHFWNYTMHLAFGNKADQGSVQNCIFKVNKMFQLPFYSNNQFFKIVLMRLIGRSTNFSGLCFIYFKYFEEFFHSLKIRD